MYFPFQYFNDYFKLAHAYWLLTLFYCYCFVFCLSALSDIYSVQHTRYSTMQPAHILASPTVQGPIYLVYWCICNAVLRGWQYAQQDALCLVEHATVSSSSQQVSGSVVIRNVSLVVTDQWTHSALPVYMSHTLVAVCGNVLVARTRYIHTHTRLTALFPGLPGLAGTRNVKPIWILLEQETVSGSGISWAICKSASLSRQIIMPLPHHSCFLQAGCPSCRPANSVIALKAQVYRL